MATGTDLGVEFRGVAYGDTPVAQMGAKIQQELKNVINAPEPIKVTADVAEPKQKLRIEGPPALEDQVNGGGTALRETPVLQQDGLGFGLLSFAANEVREHIAGPENDEPEIVKSQPAPEVPEFQNNWSPVPPGFA